MFRRIVKNVSVGCAIWLSCASVTSAQSIDSLPWPDRYFPQFKANVSSGINLPDLRQFAPPPVQVLLAEGKNFANTTHYCTDAGCGLVDAELRWVIPPVYEFVDGSLGADTLEVMVGGKNGLIDRSGRWIVPPVVAYFTDLAGGVVLAVSGGKHGIISTSGVWLLPPVYSEIDRLNSRIFVTCVDAASLKQSDANCVLFNTSSGFYGQKFGGFGREYEAGMLVTSPDNSTKSGEGLLQIFDGEWSIDPTVGTDLDIVSPNLVLSKINGLQGIMTSDEKWILEPKFDAIEILASGGFIGVQSGKPFLISKEGADISELFSPEGNRLPALKLRSQHAGFGGIFSKTLVGFALLYSDNDEAVFKIGSENIIEPISEDDRAFLSLEANTNIQKGGDIYHGASLVGVKNGPGGWIIPPEFIDIQDLEIGYIAVSKPNFESIVGEAEHQKGSFGNDFYTSTVAIECVLFNRDGEEVNRFEGSGLFSLKKIDDDLMFDNLFIGSTGCSVGQRISDTPYLFGEGFILNGNLESVQPN